MCGFDPLRRHQLHSQFIELGKHPLKTQDARLKNLILLFSLFVFAGLLAGCTVMAPMAAPLLSSTGSGGGGVQSQTTVTLATDNFSVVKTNVAGGSKGFTLLGLLPMFPARLTTAMDRMYANSGIEAGSTKTIAHLTIEHSSTYWILFSIPETKVRAQVVQFTPAIETTNAPIRVPAKSQGELRVEN